MWDGVFVMTDMLESLSEPEFPFPVELAPRIPADLHGLGTVLHGTPETGQSGSTANFRRAGRANSSRSGPARAMSPAMSDY